MNWDLVLAALPYLAAMGVSVVVGLYALQRKTVPGARAFALAALAETVWTGAYLCQRFSSRFEDLYFWNNVQLTAVLVTVIGFLDFAFRYTGTDVQARRTIGRSLVFVAVLEGALFWTDTYTHFIRTGPHIELPGGVLTFVFRDGPLFFLFPLFVYGVITYVVLLLLKNMFSSPHIYRQQVGTVLLGLTIPGAASLLSWIGVIPIPLHDLTPFSFGPANLLMFWALFRYHLFDMLPIGRDTLVERMTDGVMVLDQRRRIVDFNPAARDILGLSEIVSTGKFIGRELPVLHQFVSHLIENPRARAEISLDLKGKPARIGLEAIPLYDNLKDLTGHLVILRDITEQKKVEEKLHQMAFSDFLTGALNRRAFFELAGPEFERSRRYHHFLGFILFDVDNFKKVNDTYGHLVGDLVLKTLAQICLTNLRAADKMARYGGEEFIIMLPETSAENVLATAERLRQKVEDMQVPSEQGPVQITISLGVSVFDSIDPATRLDTLLGQADLALYQAKQAGRNRVCLWAKEFISSEVFNGNPSRLKE